MGVGEGADVEVDADTDVIAELGEAREVSVVVVLAVTESLTPRSSLSSSTMHFDRRSCKSYRTCRL